MSKFQLVFTGIFAAFLVLGVIVFAVYRSDSGLSSMPVTVWGTIDQNNMTQILTATGLSKDKSNPVTYVYKDPDTFDREFVEALAEGAGPDLVFLPHDLMLKHKKKIFPIPYSNYDERSFKDAFIQEAELFLEPDGILALPVSIDPMVMYWNRNIFQNAAISQPPKYWDEFYSLSQRLTKKDGALNITQATVGLGEYRNIAHAKEIVSTLVMQAGSPITLRTAEGRIQSVFNDRFGYTVAPAEAAVNFYTEFSNPAKSTYTWNRSMPNSKDAFIAGDLAVYFGLASELYEVQAKNPNLNFDVTYMPQSREAKNNITYGKMQGVAIVKASKVIPSAFKVALKLTDNDSISSISYANSLPPVRRNLLASKPTTAEGVVFYDSALWSRGWLDPDNEETDTIFTGMIESITGGRARTTQAVSKAGIEIQELITKEQPDKAPASVPVGAM